MTGETAEKEFRRAIQLNPEYATAHQWYAEYLSWQGRFDEALAGSDCARRAGSDVTDHRQRLQPFILYYARHYVRAIEQCEAVLKMAPGASDNFGNARNFIFLSEIEQGQIPASH